MSEKYQWFNGLKYTLDEKTGYYLNSTIRKRIHRAVWEYYNGPIPAEFQIHHIDHDKSNNTIENLVILPGKIHQSIHGQETRAVHYSELVSRMDYARKFADEWHGSPEGIEWHKKHYQEIKDKLHRKAKFVCDYCGKEFTAEVAKNNRFCSNKCKSAWRRREGADDETRICAYCGKKFRINKYAKTKCCSRSCSNRLRTVREGKTNQAHQ